MTRLTHLDDSGAAHIVDVSAKPATLREAVAQGRIRMSSEALALVRGAAANKGDVLAVARVAGIMAAKRTSELIPLCHQVALSSITVELVTDATGITATARARADGPTGVEMEALTTVTVALLTIYDMIKAVDRGMTIEDVKLLAKTGGSSSWTTKAT